MTEQSDPVSRRHLIEVFCAEANIRLHKVLEELRRGCTACDYHYVYQEFDSLQGGARAAGLEWLEHDGKVLAAYTRFLDELGPGVVPLSSHQLLTDAMTELRLYCNELSVDQILMGCQPKERIINLLADLEARMKNSVDESLSGEAVKPLTFLVVDDSATSRMLFHAHLPNADLHQIHEAGDAESALRLAREVTPDVVIMDYNMPGDNGVTIARQIQDEGINPSFILLTANLQRSVLDAARDAGFVGVLEKPVSGEKLSRLLRDLV